MKLSRLNSGAYVLVSVVSLGLLSGCTEPADGPVAPCDGQVFEVEASVIDQDTIWSCSQIVSGDLRVTEGATLTIEPGVTVFMDDGASLRVGEGGDGILRAVGTAALPITFTSLSDGGPGSYQALALDSGALEVELRHVVIEDAGAHYVTAGSGWGADAALLVNQAQLSMADVTVRDSAWNGIHFRGDAEALRFDDIEVTGVAGAAIEVGAQGAGTLAGSHRFDDDGYIVIAGGTVERTATWANLGVPYHMTDSVDVRGEQAPILTIAAGTALQFAENTFLRVGLKAQGGLIADGAEAPITFASLRAVQAAGDWQGIVLMGDTVEATLRNVEIRHAGGHYVPPGSGWGADAAIVVDDGVRLTLTGSSLHDNAGSGITFRGDASAIEFGDNTFGANDGAPIWIGAQGATTLSGSHVFEAGDRIMINGGTVSNSGSWAALGAPFAVRKPVLVEGEDAPVLTIEGGVEVLFDEGAHLSVGAQAQGALVTEAGSGGARFGSFLAVQGAGDWIGVALLDHTIDAQTSIDGATFRHCGDHYYTNFWGGDACLIARASSPTITNCVFEDSSAHGIQLMSGAAPSLVDNSFSGIAGDDINTDSL